MKHKIWTIATDRRGHWGQIGYANWSADGARNQFVDNHKRNSPDGVVPAFEVVEADYFNKDKERLEDNHIEPVDPFIDARLDGGDGFAIEIDECPRHGRQPMIIILNQGGHDATSVCPVCVAEVYAYLKTRPERGFNE